MKHCRTTLIFLLISFFSLQCQHSPEKTKIKGLPVEVPESIERRRAEGRTPSIAIAIIDPSGLKFYKFEKTAEIRAIS